LTVAHKTPLSKGNAIKPKLPRMAGHTWGQTVRWQRPGTQFSVQRR
jgi:hypothetical protein